MTMSAKVPCSCVICQGRLITPYQWRQHKKKFFLAAKGDTSSAPPPTKPVKAADIGHDGSVPTIDFPESSTGDANAAAFSLEAIIPAVDVYGEENSLISQSSDVDDKMLSAIVSWVLALVLAVMIMLLTLNLLASGVCQVCFMMTQKYLDHCIRGRTWHCFRH